MGLRLEARSHHAGLPAREPMFCVETGLKALYFSLLVRSPLFSVLRRGRVVKCQTVTLIVHRLL